MGKVISKIFGVSQKAQKIEQPVVETPIAEEKTIPSADDAALEKARKKSILAQQRRSGRKSTILTDDTLG